MIAYDAWEREYQKITQYLDIFDSFMSNQL